MIKITTLMDNFPSEQKALLAKHGLSYYIETPNKNILFDFGSGKEFIENAYKIDVNLLKVDIAVCSHAHYDHATGFKYLVKEGIKLPLYIGKGFWREKYAKNDVVCTYLGTGFNKEFLEQNGISTYECTGITKISEEVYIVTDFPRTEKYEIIQNRFVKGDIEDLMQDDFDDEICLVIKSVKGLVVVVGCSHPGILNMLNKIKDCFNEKIYAVLGGTHLVEADEERISYTIEKMISMGIEVIGLSHCSGEKVKNILSNKGISGSNLNVGSVIAI